MVGTTERGATTPADIVSPSTMAARLADGVVRSMAVARTKLSAALRKLVEGRIRRDFPSKKA